MMYTILHLSVHPPLRLVASIPDEPSSPTSPSQGQIEMQPESLAVKL